MRRKRQITKPRRKDFLSKKKVCRLCGDKARSIDYKDIAQLQKFITERGKIIPPRLSGTCARHQRTIDLAIKRARAIALLPFINK